MRERFYKLYLLLTLAAGWLSAECCISKKTATAKSSDYYGMYRSTIIIEGGLLKEYLLLDSNFMAYTILDSADYCAKKDELMRRDCIGLTKFNILGDSIRFRFDSLALIKSKGSVYINGELITIYSKKFDKNRPEIYYGKYSKDTLHLTLQIIDFRWRDTSYQKVTYIKCR
ncbi:MAG: hypothetical protein MUC87_11210 [Bacteroidia bacterium]|nr:hypothetical protein [Bacteroidia bacterium]